MLKQQCDISCSTNVTLNQQCDSYCLTIVMQNYQYDIRCLTIVVVNQQYISCLTIMALNYQCDISGLTIVMLNYYHDIRWLTIVLLNHQYDNSCFTQRESIIQFQELYFWICFVEYVGLCVVCTVDIHRAHCRTFMFSRVYVGPMPKSDSLNKF